MTLPSRSRSDSIVAVLRRQGRRLSTREILHALREDPESWVRRQKDPLQGVRRELKALEAAGIVDRERVRIIPERGPVQRGPGADMWGLR